MGNPRRHGGSTGGRRLTGVARKASGRVAVRVRPKPRLDAETTAGWLQRIGRAPRITLPGLCLLLLGLLGVWVLALTFIELPNPYQQVPDPLLYQLVWPCFALLVAVLGGPLGLTGAVLYVTLGLTQLPLFASGGGQSVLLEPAAGYWLGVVPACWLVATGMSLLMGKALTGWRWLMGCMVLALAATLVWHAVGAGYTLALVFFGSLPWVEAQVWFTRLVWPSLPYDLGFCLVGLLMSRTLRMVLLPLLY